MRANPTHQPCAWVGHVWVGFVEDVGFTAWQCNTCSTHNQASCIRQGGKHVLASKSRCPPARSPPAYTLPSPPVKRVVPGLQHLGSAKASITQHGTHLALQTGQCNKASCKHFAGELECRDRRRQTGRQGQAADRQAVMPGAGPHTMPAKPLSAARSETLCLASRQQQDERYTRPGRQRCGTLPKLMQQQREV